MLLNVWNLSFYDAVLRVQTAWEVRLLTKMTRLLLKAALQNPLNQRFVLMCGTSIPLKPACFIYTQLVAEQRSLFVIRSFTEEVKAEIGINFRFACLCACPALMMSQGTALVAQGLCLSASRGVWHLSCHHFCTLMRISCTLSLTLRPTGWPWCIGTDTVVQDGLWDTFRWPVHMHEE